jgi:hypothetical protein
VSALPSRTDLFREHQFRQARDNPTLFIEGFGQVLVVGKGWQPWKLWPHQHEIVADKFRAIQIARSIDLQANDELLLGERHVDLKSRQVGFTSIACALAVQDMMFNEDHPWILVSQGLEEAKGTLSTKVSQFYSKLPGWLRARGPTVEVDTKEVFGFSNGSSILSIPSTAHSARSKAVFGVIFDEAAFMEDAEGVFAALDPLCYGPMFVFSTANGMGNMFHSTYLESKEPGSVWRSSFYSWHVVPGRSDKWYAAQQRKYRNKEHLLAQEHPSSEAEAFLRSGRTALPVDLIDEKSQFRPPEFLLDTTLLNNSQVALERAVLPPVAEPLFGLSVWEPPAILRWPDGSLYQKPNYVVSCDSAEGLEIGDFSTIVVANVETGERVATMRNRVSIHYLGPILEILGYWYHTALIIVERNASGLVPLEYLRQVGYPRMYRQLNLAQIQLADRTPRYGWHTSNQTKPTMIHDWVKALEEDRIILHDQMMAVEASTFIIDKRGRFIAKEPNHDDLLMADFLCQQAIEDSPQFPVQWQDPMPGPPTMGELFGIGQRTEPVRGVALARPIGGGLVMSGPVHSFEIRRPDASASAGSLGSEADEGDEDPVVWYSDPRESAAREGR